MERAKFPLPYPKCLLYPRTTFVEVSIVLSLGPDTGIAIRSEEVLGEGISLVPYENDAWTRSRLQLHSQPTQIILMREGYGQGRI